MMQLLYLKKSSCCLEDDSVILRGFKDGETGEGFAKS